MSELNILNSLLISLTGYSLNGYLTSSIERMHKSDEELEETIQQAVDDEDTTLLNICIAEQLNRLED